MLSDPVYGWTAATYLSTFIAFLVVSLPELVAWVLYLLGESFWFAWWANNIGFWFSVVGMGLPVIASMLQLGLPYTQGGRRQHHCRVRRQHHVPYVLWHSNVVPVRCNALGLRDPPQMLFGG